MNYMTPAELSEKLNANNDLVLLDIRESYELEICQIGGLHIPMGDISTRVNEINSDFEVAVLCRSGKRAEAVANFLEAEAGMKKVTIVAGGILAWINTVDSSLEAY
ncbi:MAG: adenylyltransferase/sulfurtransferase [Crocinitomicaceae bacterium]|jgi:adenylyltransferase/sulfurtransferase